ncbi:MAG: SufE family protein [Hyphomicrobium sp.]|nr:SufE family protein [Hyphomicrobium sp.]
MTFDELADNFAVMDDWEDRYRYVIELGRTLAPMAADLKTDATKVRGCASQVWVATEVVSDPAGAGPRLHFLADSDAHIVRGLIAILLTVYQDKSAAEIARHDALQDFAKLGLRDHLTPQRSNGLASMVQRMRADAEAAMKQEKA